MIARDVLDAVNLLAGMRVGDPHGARRPRMPTRPAIMQHYPMREDDPMMTCSDCGAAVDKLNVFPGPRCLACWAPIGEREARTMTADKLARMWGAR